MGIVRKQSLFSSIYTYIAFGIGALNLLVLFPHFFTSEEVGLTRLLFDFLTLFGTLATMGSLNPLLKFFPFYKSHLPSKQNELPAFSFIVCLAGCILFTIAAIVFKDLMIRKFSHGSALFAAHYYLVIPLTVSYTMFLVLDAYCWLIKETVISNFVKEIVYRAYTLVLICLYILKIININVFFTLYAFMYLPAIYILGRKVFKSGLIFLCFKISYVSKKLYRKMVTFWLFHLSGMIIGILPKTIDGIMIAGINGLSETAIYALATYIVTVMEVPQRSMLGIASTLISEGWSTKDKKKIQNIYSKSSLNLMILGLLIFGVIYPNMDNLVRFLPQYSQAKNIVLIAGLAKIFDLGMGMNQQVLGFSKYWKIDFFINVFAIAITIPVNYYFITHYSIIGAALGNAIALTGVNVIRFLLIYRLFGFQPFNVQSAFILLIAAAGIFIAISIPYLGNIVLDASVRGLVFVALYVPVILYFKLSQDFYEMFLTLKKRLGLK